jgi:hypothetical protein
MVAAAIAPEDFNICDIALEIYALARQSRNRKETFRQAATWRVAKK